MKNLSRLVAFVFLSAVALFAQAGVPGTLVQQSPTKLDACSVSNKNAAVNNTATVTITPQNGQFVYVCGIDLTVSEDATGAVAQTNVAFTSTNLNSWQYEYSTASTLNTVPIDKSFYFPFPLKAAQPGVAVTIVSPALNAHAAYNINVYYYFAP